MNMIKIAGILVVGVGLAALVGGGIWYWRRRKQQQDAGTPENVPSNPSHPEDIPASETQPRGHMVDEPGVDSELRKELEKIFGESWHPPDEQIVNELQRDDVVVFAAESEPTGNYTETRQELISAKVLSVDSAAVRGRVIGPVEHAEHHGSHAGHGYRVGDLVDVPRSKVLVAARRTDTDKTGYGSQGDPAATFKPSDTTKQTYKVRPGTPYDLILPYRTKELAWYLDRKLVNLVHVGEDGLLEQIMFSEDSLRGEVSVRLLDEDPEVGAVFVARWDFELDASRCCRRVTDLLWHHTRRAWAFSAMTLSAKRLPLRVGRCWRHTHPRRQTFINRAFSAQVVGLSWPESLQTHEMDWRRRLTPRDSWDTRGSVGAASPRRSSLDTTGFVLTGQPCSKRRTPNLPRTYTMPCARGESGRPSPTKEEWRTRAQN